MRFKIAAAFLYIFGILILNGSEPAGDNISLISFMSCIPQESLTKVLSSTMNQQNETYKTQTKSYVLPETSHGRSDYEMNIIQVCNMNDKALQSKINDTLITSSASWIYGIMLESKAESPLIIYQTKRYLSIRNEFVFISSRFYDRVIEFITIDMVSGDRVFLNDIIRVNEEFIKLIKQHNIVVASENTQQFDGNAGALWKWLSEMPNNELRTRLEDCSKEQQTIIDIGPFTLDDSIGNLIFRNTFFIEEGKLVLVFEELDKRVTLDLDVIEPFLLVDKW